MKLSLFKEKYEEKVMSFLENIKDKKDILVTGHVKPDGDAIGSAFAIKYILEELNKNVHVFLHSEPDNLLFYLNERKNEYNLVREEYKNSDKKEEKDMYLYFQRQNIDSYISVDSTSLKRHGIISEKFSEDIYSMQIDHHFGNTNFAKDNIVAEGEPSATTVIYIMLLLLEEKGIIKRNKKIMEALALGMITDTCALRFPYTNFEAVELMYEAKKEDVDVSKIIRETLYSKSRKNFELEKIYKNKIEFLKDNKIANVYINEDEYDFKDEDYEGLVLSPMVINTLEVSMFFRKEKNKDNVKVSLRSKKEIIDCSHIAIKMGGGGHINAAGFEFLVENMSKPEILAKVEVIKDKLLEYFEEKINKI